MSADLDLDTPKPLVRKIAVGVLLGALGALSGYSMAVLVGDSITRWDDDLNVIMGTVLAAMAAISLFILTFRPRAIPKGCGVLQIIVLAMAGAMLLAPIFGTSFASPEVIFGGILVVLFLQTIANVMLWRIADEMLRRVMMETSALAFWALQVALFVYAAAERLGLVESITAWAMVGIMMAVYVLSSCIAAARRGIS